jgi:hypothetical protein
MFLGIGFCLIFGYLVETNKLEFEKNNEIKQNENQNWLPRLP